jgi:hypothetical protein
VFLLIIILFYYIYLKYIALFFLCIESKEISALFVVPAMLLSQMLIL